MGHLSRFVEPVVLLLLKRKGRSYGYELYADVQAHAVTDAEIDRASLYRALRILETNGNVVSGWDTGGSGPARRVYRLTAAGERHLAEWAAVLGHVSTAMARFVRDAGRALDAGRAPGASGRSPGRPVPARPSRPGRGPRGG
jgi:PadR family transcriptional regulator, regulatory protein PadR